LERRVQTRLDGVDRVGMTFLRSEASRPEKLGRTLRIAGKSFRKDVDRVSENAGEFNRLAKRDIDRFVERQPLYRRGFLRLFWGKPETIDETAISLFP
jgi:hypothetical protein